MGFKAKLGSRHRLLLLVALAASACGGAYLEGMEIADLPPTNPVATYTVSECMDVASGAKVLTPTLTYYLQAVGSSFVLYEFDPQQRGAKMTNYWFEGETDMFFSYASVANSGFRFLVPKNRTLPGKRLVYLGGQFKAEMVNGAMQVVGTPITDCAMVPSPRNAPPRPPAPVLPPPVPGGCVRDKDCAAGNICEAGACVPNKAAAPEDPSSWECQADNNCPTGKVCHQHKCIKEMLCDSDKQCRGNDVCDGGVCVPTTPDSELLAPDPLCTTDAECKGGRVCEEGQCTDKKKGPKGLGDPCKVDVDCPGHLVCEELQCQKKHKK